MSRADETVFDGLHAITAEVLKEQLEEFKKRKEMPPPALLAQAIKFLKDNGIDSPARAKKVDEALPADLPSFDDVVDEHMRAH